MVNAPGGPSGRATPTCDACPWTLTSISAGTCRESVKWIDGALCLCPFPVLLAFPYHGHGPFPSPVNVTCADCSFLVNSSFRHVERS